MGKRDNELYRQTLLESRSKSEDDFEKYITYISAGALGLSFSFIDKIVPLAEASHLWAMIVGWILLVLTLLGNLFSHFLSKKFTDKTLADFETIDSDQLSHNIDSRNNIIEGINVTTIITLVLGITAILLFVALNFQENA